MYHITIIIWYVVSYRQKNTGRPTRPVRPLPPKLSAGERDLHQRAMLEGTYQGLLDYPNLKALDIVSDIAKAICTETTQLRRDIFINSWLGGYEAVLLQMLNAKRETESTAALVKVLPREQALTLLQSFHRLSS